MQKYLTTNQKDKLLPYLLDRDGVNCFYCRKPFQVGARKEQRRTIDHLDDEHTHNEKENLVLSHFECNQIKKNSAEFQIMAQAKLKENHSSFVSLRVGIPHEPKATTKEIDINVQTWRLVKQFIDERLLNQNKPALDLNDTAHSISYLLKEQTGHGSDQTAKRHILDYCSDVAPFKCIEENGKWIILKRD